MCKNLAILKELLEKQIWADFVQKSLNLQQEKFRSKKKKGCWGWEPSHSIGINVPNVEYIKCRISDGMRIIHQNPQNFIHKQILVDSQKKYKNIRKKKGEKI
jgi:hypothetical protein